MKPIFLRCEYLINPIGIDIKKPRLYWQFEIEEDSYGFKQSAYQIKAAESIDDLENNVLTWNTEKVKSDEFTHIVYEGKELESRKRIYWKVKVWDQDGIESEWSEPSFFEMGLLKLEDWKAKWIDPEKEIEPKTQYPASYLRKEFTIKEPINKARLYITSCGVYEAYINGERVGDQVFTPGATNYNKRLQYQTYDVTEQIFIGENAIGAILGDGWFRGNISNYAWRNIYGERLLLLAQLEIELVNGERVIIVTDNQWKATQEGPIRLSDLQDGEVYDANRELHGWNTTDFEDIDWTNVTVDHWDYKVLVASNSVAIREKELFIPTVIDTPDGSTVLDFGQNLAGYVKFRVSGRKGHKVTLIHGETLDQDGNFTMEHLNNSSRPKERPLKQEINYILRGDGVEEFKPHFTVHGFRYVLVKNWPEKVEASNFASIAVYSDMEQTGEFECSNEMINKLVKNTLWSQKSNFLDIPTDCPQRERAGWTGDAQVFVRTGSTLMNTATFFTKWMKDVAVQQNDNGMVCNISPSVGVERDKGMKNVEGSAGWGDAAVIIPWTLWKLYGDKRILEDQWDSMKSWVDYESNCAKKTHWVRIFKKNPYRKYTWDTKFHWGEWAEPPSKDYAGANIVKQVIFSVPEVATAYFAYSSKLLSQCAEVLGKKDEATKYREISEKAKKAYIYNFTNNGEIETSRQCLYVRPVALGLLPEDKIGKAVDKLAKLVEERNYHIGTGFLSTPFICKILCDYGYVETAYKLVEQTTAPSWLYPITKGATTIWEHWDGINEENVPRESLNHYSYGAVVGWFFQYVAGIDIDSEAAGYKDFIIAPKPGGTLTRAKGIYNSIYGKIESSWERVEGLFRLRVQIPPNTSAKIILPCKDMDKAKVVNRKASISEFYIENGQVCIILGSGIYEFTCF
ncbi:family 78 glycoside hydrolase catalytic domain [Clostridium sp. YIM B02505]|uniref:alpha-L-rhamnosidase n=1 Tax=Clostridium yunnanense TaxID=2800325 RepID=A0ABS1EKS9_9CLOT|nr:alpha-L-rhamnosidase [Clostridium yunnanense]MBK1809974.1 family 78 glycoside hydrolase catalytic domain [Clostridium yunnanense]